MSKASPSTNAHLALSASFSRVRDSVTLKRDPEGVEPRAVDSARLRGPGLVSGKAVRPQTRSSKQLMAHNQFLGDRRQRLALKGRVLQANALPQSGAINH